MARNLSLDAWGVLRSVAHFSVQQPPSAFALHFVNEQSNKSLQAGSALHAAVCVLHSVEYAPVEMFVQSEHDWPLEEVIPDEPDAPDEPDDEVEVIPDVPEEDEVEVIPDVPDELEELVDELPVVPVVVSSLHAASESSAAAPTKTPNTPS